MKRIPLLLGPWLASTIVSAAYADGGYYAGVKGARAAGRAGAFTARADDLSAVALNPAGLARLDFTVLQLGNRFSYNAHAYSRAATQDWGHPEGGVAPRVEFATVENQRPWQVLDPLVGVGSNLGLRNWGFALAAYAPAGVGAQEFPVDGGQRYMMVSREVVILNYCASAAWRYRDVFGVGASLQWIYVPRLRYSLVIDGTVLSRTANPVWSELDMLASVNTSDPFTFNSIVGAWYRPVPYLELGASGQVIPTQIRAHGTLSVDPLSSEVDEEVELRRDGEPANDVTVSLPLPLTARAGIRYRGLKADREVFDVELDVTYESWSRVERFTVDTNDMSATLLAQRIELGMIEIEKQWRDTIGVALGSDYAVIPDGMTLRGGIFYDTAVADRRYAHVDFFSGTQVGGAVGTSVFVPPFEVALAYEYRHQLPVKVTEGEAKVYQQVPGSTCDPPYTDPDTCHEQFLGQPAPAVNAGSYRAHAHVASVDLFYRF